MTTSSICISEEISYPIVLSHHSLHMFSKQNIWISVPWTNLEDCEVSTSDKYLLMMLSCIYKHPGIYSKLNQIKACNQVSATENDIHKSQQHLADMNYYVRPHRLFSGWWRRYLEVFKYSLHIDCELKWGKPFFINYYERLWNITISVPRTCDWYHWIQKLLQSTSFWHLQPLIQDHNHHFCNPLKSFTG